MSAEPQHTGAEELMEAEIKAEHMGGPAAEKEVHTALDNVAGVEQVRIDGDTIAVCYDPVEVSKAELGKKLDTAGHHPVEVKAERDSPMH
jgi:copper chaperone CopZ